MAVRELLEKKGRKAITIDGGHTVEEAVHRMATHNVSALVVLENAQPVGMFAERDLLRTYLTHRQRPFSEIRLVEAMTPRLLVAAPQDDTASTLEMMLREGIRHLPVVENRSIVGMLTANDLIEHHLGFLDAEMGYLRDYIADLHEAGRD
ncbi:MAG: hypothetical protein AMJ54_01030 [Deltaproteobacteria bacterium SG8_13]|nr:MAG: hypothetical protein AMJ54_01030 [Deltaproteobacteria bacterium SG8_13]